MTTTICAMINKNCAVKLTQAKQNKAYLNFPIEAELFIFRVLTYT